MTEGPTRASRREFIRIAGLLVSGLSLRGCVSPPAAGRSDATADAAVDAMDDATGTSGADAVDVTPDVTTDPSALPTLGGAPDTHEGRVVAAFIDTVTPGRHRDPQGEVGGLDVGAPGMFFDPELPAAPFVPLLVLFLDGAAAAAHDGATFDALAPADRDVVLGQALVTTPVLEFAVQLAKLAYYSTPDAGRTVGYPGPNAGYVNDADFGFGVAVTAELTADGNYP